MDNVRVIDSGNAVDTNGTSLMGFVRATYAELTDLFGEDLGGGDKTTAEWALLIEVPAVDCNTQDYSGEMEHIVATIYDWKTSSTPYGEYDWHVGGYSKSAVWYVQDLLNEYRQRAS